MVTILHISDLHREESSEVSNAALLESLTRDISKCIREEPTLRAPDIALVSGDLIRGVTPDCANPLGELDRQYRQAEEFLGGLVDRLLAGDRGRLVIVPGNHDVSLYHTMASMKRIPITSVDPDRLKLLTTYAKRPGTNASSVRWSWHDLCFYEIINADLYKERLDAFCAMYHRFYAGRRKYSLRADEQYDLFDYPEFGLTLAGFNSCFDNDPLNRRGVIHAPAVAAAAEALRNGHYTGRLLGAVWHHNTSGGPAESDYLDTSVIQVLIDLGFSVGFHGHQHRPDFIEERFAFGPGRKMTLLAAVSLCAGPRQLPSGAARSYNIVQINADTCQGVLYQRQAQNSTYEYPIWGPGRLPINNRSSATFDLQRPSDSNVTARRLADIGRAERLIGSEDFDAAVPLLLPIAAVAPLARRLLLECYVALDDQQAIAKEFKVPQSITEATHLAEALRVLKRPQELKQLLDTELFRDPSNAAVRRKYCERIGE